MCEQSSAKEINFSYLNTVNEINKQFTIKAIDMKFNRDHLCVIIDLKSAHFVFGLSLSEIILILIFFFYLFGGGGDVALTGFVVYAVAVVVVSRSS